jgi:hypothetical protein
MNKLLCTLTDIQQLFLNTFQQSGEEVSDPIAGQFNNPGWSNRTWGSSLYRKAHVNIIDVMDTRGLWMMHCCIYPHYHNPAPIFGFDVFAGKNKITGCFHDFSPVMANHSLSDWFKEESEKLEWNKKRELPDWGKRIFSDSIIAAGNIQSDEELEQILNTITTTLQTYISSLSDTNNTIDDISDKHQYYIENQRLNPHNPRVLMSLGLSEDQASLYVTNCLFPSN